MAQPILTPNEIAAFARAPRTVIEKALERRMLKASKSSREARGARRHLPLHAVAYAAVVARLGRRLTVADQRLLASRLAEMSSSDLATAEIEVAPAMVIKIGELAGDAVRKAEDYAAARDRYIERVPGVMGGRPVIRNTRITVSAVHQRLADGDTIADLVDDYPDIPPEAFAAADMYAKAYPRVGRPPTFA